ncbi:LPXTG cell wall anchor domain-containing protein [Streptomyces spiralis]|uniref:LPXTG cell wall anchor domain-containing protein n=1 Tax=Streptomyces spiralis TaxID=66376 RepID=UPI0033EEA41E
MRTLIRAGAVTAGVSAALAIAPLAHAASQNSHHGDNGTVKIHDAKTGEELRRNEPHVCTFYLDAFGFDGGQQVDWHIETWAPTGAVKGDTVKAGDITLDADGHGRTEDLSLPDGHYKLFWNFDGEKSAAAKHKVFWTDCAPENGGSGSTPSTPGTTPGGPGSTPSGSTAPTASASPTAEATSSGAAPAASSSPSAQGGASGDLAETGSSAPVGLLSGVAATLVAAGGFLVLRRRARRG